MSESASPKRSYDSSGRRARSAQTHARVIAAAAKVFVEKGYAGATIPAIAAEAGVALQTVYRAAPGKAGLLEAAVTAAVAGGADRAAVPVEERLAIRAIIEEADPRRQLALYAHTQPGIWSRVGPLMRVLEAAATSEPELKQLLAAQGDLRLAGHRRFMGLLSDRGVLRDDLTPERAADVLWAVCSQATYDSLVVARGWSPSEYESWLASTLQDALLR